MRTACTAHVILLNANTGNKKKKVKSKSLASQPIKMQNVKIHDNPPCTNLGGLL